MKTNNGHEKGGFVEQKRGKKKQFFDGKWKKKRKEMIVPRKHFSEVSTKKTRM
jgi:hypothetical protein